MQTHAQAFMHNVESKKIQAVAKETNLSLLHCGYDSLCTVVVLRFLGFECSSASAGILFIRIDPRFIIQYF